MCDTRGYGGVCGCTSLYVDAAASTLLSLSVISLKGMLCTSISTQPRPWRCSWTPCCFHLDCFCLCGIPNRFLYSLSPQRATPAVYSTDLSWPLPLPAGVCLCAFHAPIGRAEQRAARDIDTPCPTDFHLSSPNRYSRWEIHWSLSLQPLVDSSTTNTPID
jgi:hypothetical protein